MYIKSFQDFQASIAWFLKSDNKYRLQRLIYVLQIGNMQPVNVFSEENL